MDAVDLCVEDGVMSRCAAAMAIAVATNASDEHRLHFVFAWPLQDDSVVQAGGNGGASVTWCEATLHARERRVIWVAEGDDVRRDPTTSWPHDGGVRVVGDRCLASSDSDAAASVIGEFHRPILPRATRGRRTEGCARRGQCPSPPPGWRSVLRREVQ